MLEAASKVETSRPVVKRDAPRVRLLLSMFISALAASLLILKFAPAPFFWLWLTWATALFLAVFFARSSWPRAIFLNLGVGACLLASAEAYLITHEYTPPIFSKGFYVRSDVLGWEPARGMQVHAFKAGPPGLLHGPEGILFNTTYTINSQGLRVAPPWREDLAGTALFFGCSFTFGEGLSDHETLPYQVGVQSGGRWRTFNFGFEAYGPEQMQAEIESGMVRRIVDATPQYAFYVALPVHVWRVAGRVAWGGHAPRYVLNSDGSVHQAGYYDPESLDDRLGLGYNSRLRGQLDKSAIWRAIAYRDSRVTDKDIRLYFAVVRRSQELLKTQFPGIRFEVILWPNQNAPQQRYVYEKLRDGFRRMGYPLYLVADILPGYKTDRSPYILGPSDHHPNALADRMLAHYIVKKILVADTSSRPATGKSAPKPGALASR